jgi:hypothetical protein
VHPRCLYAAETKASKPVLAAEIGQGHTRIKSEINITSASGNAGLLIVENMEQVYVPQLAKLIDYFNL